MSAEERGELTVLVVDDQLLLIRAVKQALDHAGRFRVVSTTSAAEALRLIEVEPDIRLALLDVMMPEMSGVELAERIRAVLPGLPIVHMTGSPESASELMQERGWSGPVLHKPFPVYELVQRLEEILGDLT